VFQVDSYPAGGGYVMAHAFPVNGNDVIRNVGGTQVPVPLDLAVLVE
jgi:hypothetical protein